MGLYPFQQEAVDKLLSTKAPHSLIADEMGLGKTVEAIALDLEYRKLVPNGKQPRTLVIAPLSVIPSWVSHFETWSGLKVLSIDPKNRSDFQARVEACDADVFVCHWESLRLMPKLQKVEWFHIIADEVHRSKNRKAQQTMALKKLQTKYKTGLSGTPADNKPQDLWSVLNWLYPKTWSSYWRFFNYHVIYAKHNTGTCMVEGCDKYHRTSFREIMGCANLEELHGMMKPFYVRRLKQEVLKDLPDKYYTTIQVDLTSKQRKVYNDMRENMLAWIGEHEQEPIAAPVAIAQLTRLQQFACAFADIVEVKKRNKNTGKIVKVKKVNLIDPSSKLDTVMEILKDNEDEQVVVFCQSKQVINLFAQRLEAAGIAHGILTGDTKQNDRGRLVEEFQAGKLRVFAGTISAGGVGITLTAASTVIFLDRAWSPAINRQAEDRLHRIGQKSAVQVIDIVARDTVDMGRLQKIELKWSWLRQVLGDGDAK